MSVQDSIDGRLPVTVLSDSLGPARRPCSTINRQIPRDRWPASEVFVRMMKANWDVNRDANRGDRRQDIMFIGIDTDKHAICRRLHACLVKEQAFVPKLWTRLPDPSSAWRQAAAA